MAQDERDFLSRMGGVGGDFVNILPDISEPRKLDGLSFLDLSSINKPANEKLDSNDIETIFSTRANLVVGARPEAFVDGGRITPGQLIIGEISIFNALENLGKFIQEVGDDPEVDDVKPEMVQELKKLTREFIVNCVQYLHKKGRFDGLIITRILLAINWAGAGGMLQGTAPETGLIRVPNQSTGPKSRHEFFVIGHDCSTDEEAVERQQEFINGDPSKDKQAFIQAGKMLKFRSLFQYKLMMEDAGFSTACAIGNDLDTTTTSIPVDDFEALLPAKFLKSDRTDQDEDLELAFVSVLCSGGAQEKYSAEKEGGGLGRELF